MFETRMTAAEWVEARDTLATALGDVYGCGLFLARECAEQLLSFGRIDLEVLGGSDDDAVRKSDRTA